MGRFDSHRLLDLDDLPPSNRSSTRPPDKTFRVRSCSSAQAIETAAFPGYIAKAPGLVNIAHGGNRRNPAACAGHSSDGVAPRVFYSWREPLTDSGRLSPPPRPASWRTSAEVESPQLILASPHGDAPVRRMRKRHKPLIGSAMNSLQGRVLPDSTSCHQIFFFFTLQLSWPDIRQIRRAITAFSRSRRRTRAFEASVRSGTRVCGGCLEAATLPKVGINSKNIGTKHLPCIQLVRDPDGVSGHDAVMSNLMDDGGRLCGISMDGGHHEKGGGADIFCRLPTRRGASYLRIFQQRRRRVSRIAPVYQRRIQVWPQGRSCG